ncbi:MAG: hypothetical protein IPJ31_15325 [Bacteroidetes bacterium]|nr:hypothetical protein [Bacteroidota bacterium]
MGTQRVTKWVFDRNNHDLKRIDDSTQYAPIFREGDKMVYSAKVINLSDRDLSGRQTLF